MARSDDDPFGWYSGMHSWRSMSQFPESAAQAWHTAPSRDMPSTQKRYEKIALLGQGGMGQVWLGWDAILERHVAIKEPHDSGRVRLRREAMLTARLEHPGIVKIHDIYQNDKHELFVMQLVSGEPLGELLVARDKPFSRESTSRLVRVLLRTCEALAHAHAQQILHGDLSPRNIMITPDGATYIIDWGLARPLDTNTNHPVIDVDLGTAGTPGFLAPELTSAQQATLATDVWSLGALLHTILEGHPPHTSYKPRSLTHYPRSQRALAAIMNRCLASNPRDRYADAGQLANELDAWFEGRRLDAYSPSPGEAIVQLVRAHRTLTTTITLFTVALLTTITAGLVQTRHEASRAQKAEQLARQEAEQSRRVLIEAHISQAEQALATRDTYLASEFVREGLELGNHPGLRGLLMKLGAISLPRRLSREPLPKACLHRAFIVPPGDTLLCIDPERFRASLYQHGTETWRYEPLFDLKRQLEPGELPDSHEFRRIYEDNPFEPRSPALHINFLDLRADQNTIHLLDDNRFLHTLDRKTGELVEFDARRGEFFSTDNHRRVLWDEKDTSHRGLFPCPTHNSAVRAKVSRHGSTIHYLCGDGSVFKSGAEHVEQVLLENSGVDALLEHHTTRTLYLANRSGTIWRHGEEKKPLLGHLAPMEMLEVEDTPFILVKGIEGELELFDTRTMQWSTSLPSNARTIYVGEEGVVSMIRGGVLEQWQIPDHTRVERHEGEHGFANLAWSARGDTLAGVDGGGNVHVIDPQGGRTKALPLSSNVAKSVAPGGDLTTFHVATINMERLHEIHVTRSDARLTVVHGEGAAFNTSLRRVGALKSGALCALTYGFAVMVALPGQDVATRIESTSSFVDLSATPSRDMILAVNNEVVWRIDDADPLAPQSISLDLLENPTHVAARHDHSFALMNRQRVRVYDRQGVTLGEHAFDTMPLDMQWHPESPWLFLSFADGSMEVYHVDQDGSFELLAHVRSHRARASGVSVHPAGEWAATSSWDATLELYDLHPLQMTHEEMLAIVNQDL